ncbi:plasmid IncI1-type surface exclusion protein ExcA [Pantoea septica]|uniref:plasmid IncI1-type surface exclusion protein ExcA n=1 Tax=Pantoea septica TaxID=472695 RepID=UPI0028AEAF0C|nr:plasmid IncI1-type surface exclusion protein ExcA [Pantoea septica]
MKSAHKTENWLDIIWAFTKTAYYFIYLPCALVIAALTLIVSMGSSSHTLFVTDYFLLSLLWLSILVPLGYRRFVIRNKRQKLFKIVAMLSSSERFSPQKHHQVMDAGRGKYLGIDTKSGNILYIHMVKKGVVDVIGLTMRDWTDRELEGGTLRLNTKNTEVPVLSITAHPIVAKELFSTLGAMSHNSYSEAFPKEPWPLHVNIQSQFVQFEHNVVVPQAV